MLRWVAYADFMQGEWDRFAQAHGTVFHTTAFRRILLESFHYQCGYHAMVDGNDRIRALIPLVIGRNLGMKRVAVSLPFVNYLDICADGEEIRRLTVDAIAKIKNEQGLDTAELRLKDQMTDKPDWQSHLQNYTFVLPLLPDEEATLAQASSSCRNHVRKTYKNDWFAVSFDPGLLPDFYRVYVRRMKQLGSPAPALSFFEGFFRHFPNEAFLLTVLDKATEKVIGGMLLLKSGCNSTLYYPYGANLEEYNHQYMNNFMYWEAIRFGIRSGLKFLDLGRSPAGSGTFNFKTQWGAKPELLSYLYHGSDERAPGPPDREKLRFFIELWKVVPAFLTDRTGPLLIKYLMP